MNELDSFRWILLIIGIIVIFAVYTVSKISKKSKNRETAAHDSDRLLYTESTGTDADERLKSRAGESIDSAAHSNETSEKVITIYLVSESGNHFSGSDIMRAAKSTDLVLSEKNIFHKIIDFDGSSVSVFSVANITEPGTFNADEMYRFTTRGLVFFLVLPVEINGMQAFEMLIETVTKFKKLLNGVLTSKDKATLTDEKIQQMREEVQEFVY